MREKLLIYGAGGLTMQLFASLDFQFDNKFDYIIYDEVNKPFKFLNKYLTCNKIPSDCKKFCLCVSGTKQRQLITNELLNKNLNPITYCAVEAPEQFVKLGGNNLILRGCIIEPNIEIGFGTMVNTGCFIHHGTKIGSYCEIAPRATILGNVTIGDLTFIGAGAIIRNKIKIGKNCIIGMGSNVIKDIPNNVVAYGNPCKIVKNNVDF